MELFYDGAGHYNFEDQLKTTLQPFCEDDLCMTLFLERLVILRERRNTEHKKWLNEMKEPQEVYTLMEVDNEENQFVKKKLAAWITYVDAYNDLYPHRQTTLSACSPYSEEELIKMSFHGETRYPQIDVSPQGTELSTKPLSGLQKYMELINARKQPNEKSEFESKLEKRINGLLNKPKMRKNAKSIERFDKLLKGRWSKKSSKRKSKSLPDGARERKRSRGD
ncbi:unnamed protein product [Peronospora farinosa]|uniref:Uncharacterized protein n=1 Tax=Peronospora farinosa TaxID=134698 RepID=A0ABN8CCJ3_9STRA|nr:unnamed protein product [Peronospora farinosa]